MKNKKRFIAPIEVEILPIFIGRLQRKAGNKFFRNDNVVLLKKNTNQLFNFLMIIW